MKFVRVISHISSVYWFSSFILFLVKCKYAECIARCRIPIVCGKDSQINLQWRDIMHCAGMSSPEHDQNIKSIAKQVSTIKNEYRTSEDRINALLTSYNVSVFVPTNFSSERTAKNRRRCMTPALCTTDLGNRPAWINLEGDDLMGSKYTSKYKSLADELVYLKINYEELIQRHRSDIDECRSNSICSHITGSVCRKTAGSYTCECKNGYRMNANKSTCIECEMCFNRTCYWFETFGSMTTNRKAAADHCERRSGTLAKFQSIKHMKAVYKYLKQKRKLPENIWTGMELKNTGSKSITLPDGLESALVKFSSKRCRTNSSAMFYRYDPLSYMKGGLGTVQQSCELYGSICESTDGVQIDSDDTGECAAGDPCYSITNSVYNDTEDGYSCNCTRGYELNTKGDACVDVNECATNKNDCDVNATCTNTNGSYTCTCNDRFYGNGYNCSACHVYFNETCFWFILRAVGSTNFALAKDDCGKSSGSPAVFQSIDHMDTVNKYLKKQRLTGTGYWTGIKLKRGNTTYVLPDGSRISIDRNSCYNPNCTGIVMKVNKDAASLLLALEKYAHYGSFCETSTDN